MHALPLRALVCAGSVCRYHTLTTTVLVATTRSFLSRASASSSKINSSPEPPSSGQPSTAESCIHKPQTAEEQTLKERCLEMLVERERELEEVKAKSGLAKRATTSSPSQSSHKHPSSPLSHSTVKPFYLDPRILSLFKRLDSVHSRYESETPEIDLKRWSNNDPNFEPYTPTKMQKMVMCMVKEYNTIETMLKQRENYILAKDWVDGLRLGFETRRGSSKLGKGIKMTSGETTTETTESTKLNENGKNQNVEETAAAATWKKWESWDASHISHLLSEQRIYNFFKGRLVEVVTKRIQNATPSRLLWEDKQAQKYKTRRKLMQKRAESGERQKKPKIVDRWRSNTKTIGKESNAR